MNGRKSSVRVTIVGEEYTIRSDASPEHTRAVAEHVDRAIREIMNSGAVAETRKAAILAALQITDDLFQARAQSEEIAEGMQQLSSEIRGRPPPAQPGNGGNPERRRALPFVPPGRSFSAVTAFGVGPSALCS